MIPLTFLYDQCIDRPKMSEQKKQNPFEFIVPRPQGVGTKILKTEILKKRLKIFVKF